MTCPCGRTATETVIANPLTGEPITLIRCPDGCCGREYVQTHQGPRWIKSALWCQDPECDTPNFRVLQHPRYGHLIPLWPTAACVVAWYHVPHATINGGQGDAKTAQYYCSAFCAPNIGDLPHHALECGGEPHPDTIGACMAIERAKERHAECFTAERGAFYKTWLTDHLHLPAAQIEQLMAWWEADRVA